MRPTRSWRAAVLVAVMSLCAAGVAQPTDPAPAAPPSSPPAPDVPGAVPRAVPMPTEPATSPGSQPAGVPAATPVPAAPAAEPKPGQELFVAAAAAVTKAQVITYRAKAYATGDFLASMLSKIQADVRMLRNPDGSGWLMRSTGTGSSRSMGDNAEFDVAWLSTTTEWVDHAAKKVIEKQRAVGAAFQIAMTSRLDEMIAGKPFAIEMTSPDYVIEEPREQGGVMCDVVLVLNGKSKVRWWIGQEDHLPRKKERILENSVAAGSMIIELDAVTVENDSPPRLKPEMLRVPVPEGYAEDRPSPPPLPVAAPVSKGADESGLGGAKPLAPVPSTDAPAKAPEAARPAPPPPARDFELRTAAGEKVSLASLKGSVVVLEFGGSWCLPLREAHPELESLYKQYQGAGLKVYVLDVRERSRENIIDDLRKGGMTFGLLLDADPVARQYGIAKFPTYCVVNKLGMLVKVEGGYTRDQTIPSVRQAVEAALDIAVTPMPRVEAAPTATDGKDGKKDAPKVDGKSPSGAAMPVVEKKSS